MEINPNRFVGGVFPVTGGSKANGPAAVGPSASFEGSEGLNAALAATDDVRADVVRRAESLVASASYPPPEIINRIANLLAANLAGVEE